MKVKIEFTLDIDKDEYEKEYGESYTQAQVREDVRAAAIDAAIEHFSPFSFLMDGQQAEEKAARR